jgi:preprotein translocase subunit Sss1
MLLNLLKIAGLALSTLSAVIATLKETKTPDKKHLTLAGAVLLALGLVGFFIALGAQLKEWDQSRLAEQASQQRTQQLLIEIRRAVTKFDTISMNITYNWPLDEPEFANYRDRVTRLILRINNESPFLGAGQVAFGLRVVSRTTDRISILSPVPGSSAFPGNADGAAERFYSVAPRLHIAIYRKPIGAAEFDAFKEGRSSFADLLLVPRDGKETLLFVPDSNGKVSSANYRQTGMAIPNETWSPSGRVVSTEDLSESVAVIYLPFGTSDAVRRLWATNPPQLVLYFNHRPFLITPADLTLGKEKSGNAIFLYKFAKNLITPSENDAQPIKVGDPPPTSSKTDWIDRALGPFNIIFSGLLVAVGAFQAWFLYKTLGAIKRQADSMDSQGNALKESNAAARDNAEAAKANAAAAEENVALVRSQLRATQISERAWVVPTIGPIKETNAGSAFQIVCEMTNNGRTPAWVNAAGSVGIVLSDGQEIPKIPAYTYMGPFNKAGALLATGGSLPQGFPLSKDLLAKVVKNETKLFVTGFVEYRDIYGEEHRTSYCYQLKQSQDLTRTELLDSYVAGPPELNDAT